jgi:hypothetical protein
MLRDDQWRALHLEPEVVRQRAAFFLRERPKEPHEQTAHIPALEPQVERSVRPRRGV